MPVEIGKSWADDVEELDQTGIEETVDENGIRTITQYTTNEEGKKVKIVKKIRRIEKRTLVNHQVAERKNWAKFGAERGSKPGPDNATTTVGENVALKIHAGAKATEIEQQEQAKTPSAHKKLKCRLCHGEHFTTKCPYRNELEGIGLDVDPDDMPPAEGPATTANQSGSKYVPPIRRAGGGGGGAGESMNRSRDDLPTLRVTNVSEDATDEDIRELFSRFGRVHRVYIGRDRETGIGKGYAFVSFEDRAVAERAMHKVHGMGYDNLILNCQWSQPREARPAPP
ncbi:translation initiation factor eIF3 subunit g [Serendipita sp. 396]|nr:translation initiation factor eIF3 subunit g [Serendipita sp. 396]KAG8785540.1 translation initiation factor eIF3 subunit g [Serendipita sp. 397]KAG8802390.1 translation initiation factor eIF3 subunit g [Serendipita sp. 398]KAG8828862.1 translation initiation factor eIF3 subunit g [Serendipita sp. 401]KAG8837858.1 translation initiation factor eIF3 subunit g [Serendipita sp. 400]KAG8858840.1 translation initiation factor eIF3 subunit g [Serendipita sp. 411]KAG8871760.1 translation initiati